MGCSVLIVDDNKTTRKLLTFALSQSNYKILTASNGIEALEILAENDISAVITDLNMPQMDGLELVKTIRSDPAKGSLPIIMLTTQTDDLDRERALEAGVTEFFHKPLNLDKFRDEVKKLIK